MSRTRLFSRSTCAATVNDLVDLQLNMRENNKWMFTPNETYKNL